MLASCSCLNRRLTAFVQRHVYCWHLTPFRRPRVQFDLCCRPQPRLASSPAAVPAAAPRQTAREAQQQQSLRRHGHCSASAAAATGQPEGGCCAHNETIVSAHMSSVFTHSA